AVGEGRAVALGLDEAGLELLDRGQVRHRARALDLAFETVAREHDVGDRLGLEQLDAGGIGLLAGNFRQRLRLEQGEERFECGHADPATMTGLTRGEQLATGEPDPRVWPLQGHRDNQTSTWARRRPWRDNARSAEGPQVL